MPEVEHYHRRRSIAIGKTLLKQGGFGCFNIRRERMIKQGAVKK